MEHYMAKKKITIESSLADFKKSYEAKTKLIEREKEDFLFALGKQWSADDLKNYEERKIKPVTDNRIQPNIFLLTGLERQNRSEFKAYPEGQEDSLKAEVASSLFKNSVKKSDFLYKTSEQFKDGVTCGESHLELYLDNTYDLINGTPVWRKADGDCIFPEPGFREYDYSDARYVFKVTKDLSVDDLISLYPEKKSLIEKSNPTKINYILDPTGTHRQRREYPTTGGESQSGEKDKDDNCDLLERFYKKFVDRHYIADKANGTIIEAENKEKADEFIQGYLNEIQANEAQYQQDVQLYQQQVAASQTIDPVSGLSLAPTPIEPIAPPANNPERFVHYTRYIPEIWLFAQVPGIDQPLADERAWFYPSWKRYPFVPYYARFSTAPLSGDDANLLVQGIVCPVKNAQEIHNKAVTLELLHLNTSTNSGWLSEEDSWVDSNKVRDLGATPGVNLEYKKGSPKPERVFPNPLSQGHAQISQQAAESIKGQLGINADLLAAEQGGAQSGRAIALRQRQGLLMVQELFDNLSRSRTIAGKFLLSQMGKMYDTETAKKVLGEAFMLQNFGVPQMTQGVDPMTGQIVPVPARGQDGQVIMEIDHEAADEVISEVLSGELETYDVAVGEAVSSETMRMANSADLKDFATTYPGLLPPDLLIEESMLPQSVKTKVVNSIKQAQAAQAMMPPPGAMPRMPVGAGR
jgi:hypothetical protein